jgi:hypothetical protein
MKVSSRNSLPLIESSDCIQIIMHPGVASLAIINGALGFADDIGWERSRVSARH